MPKKKKKKGLTSSELSKQLVKIGRKMAAAQIRAYWQEGAPRDSAVKFLKWLEENHTPKVADGAMKAKRMEKLDREIAVLAQNEIRQKRQNAKEEGSLIPFDVVQEALVKGMAALFAQIDRSFSVELPPSLKGMDEAAIAGRCKSCAETFKELIRAELLKIGAEGMQKTETEIKHES